MGRGDAPGRLTAPTCATARLCAKVKPTPGLTQGAGNVMSNERKPHVAPHRRPEGPLSRRGRGRQNYFWCSCGLSSKQPFCDGSHKTTDMTPVKYTATTDGKVYFCGCKHAINKPLCDGTHGKL